LILNEVFNVGYIIYTSQQYWYWERQACLFVFKQKYRDRGRAVGALWN
jgi:hypothetical protein